ncbi:MAG: hypothetical protein PPP55_03705 [Halorubrum sp.]
MREPFDPSFEFDRGAVVWVAASTVLLCVVVVFRFGRPAWSLPAAFVAGGVAATRGGFYDPAANNGFVGVLLGMPMVAATFYVYRFGGIPALGADPDRLFLTAVGTGADMIGYAPMMVVFGYLGGVVGDRLRRRLRPPIGYPDAEPTRSVRRRRQGER